MSEMNEIITPKRQVDYDRIIKELTSAKEYMEGHWEGTKMNLRKWCEERDLEYIRMINHTFPLKKATDNEACQKILDDRIAELKTKKEKKEAPPAEKVKKTTTTYNGPKPEDYTKVRKYQGALRLKMWEKYRKIGETLEALQKAVREAGVQDQVLEKAEGAPVMRRILLMLVKKPEEVKEFTTVEEMNEDIKEMVAQWDEIHAPQ
jgi:hypothetical protein